jgi:hypothetical protein
MVSLLPIFKCSLGMSLSWSFEAGQYSKTKTKTKTLIFSIEFIFERKLGIDPANNEFPEIQAWMMRTKEEAAYKKAVHKTGYTLEGDFKK